MNKCRLVIAALAFLVAPWALAHEFWIEPSSFRPAVGSVVTARLMVGEGFLGEALPRNESHILRFIQASSAGETPMLGNLGNEPAGAARVQAPGFFLIGYESRSREVKLEGKTLESYITSEGLEPFFPADRTQPIQDHFSRYAKSLLVAEGSEAPAGGWNHKLGFALELIPEADPAALKAGEKLPVQLLQAGKPLAGALVSARRKGPGEKKVSVRTDALGRVLLPVDGAGVWLIHAVWMRPVAGKSAEWESLWASLTFAKP